jgi:predicted secreted protein
MKNKFLKLALFLLPISALSYEINFNKTFSKVVNPDLLTTQINISVEKKDESKVNSEIEKFNDFIKSVKDVKLKDGSFTLSPKYKYFENKQQFLGYIGNIRYTAESSSAKDLNEFMDKLISIKEKANSDETKLNISNVSWKVSDELRNKSFDELRLETIVWIEDYTNGLSKKVGKECSVKKINFNEMNYIDVPYARAEMAYSAMAKTSADMTPMSSEKNITINPNFELECK